MPADPCTQEELETKFLGLAQRVKSAQQASQILRVVQALAGSATLRPLTPLLKS
jgi:hypothetical protein